MSAVSKAVIIEAMLHKYYHETPAKPVWAQMIRDWLDALEPFSVAEVEAACREHVRENPSQRPNEGHICKRLNARRALARKRLALPPAELHRDRIKAETASAIIAEFGFGRKFGGEE